jgi:hypothetical protein
MTHNLSLSCHVDEDGRYAADVGWGLGGLSVMAEGTDLILDILRPHVLFRAVFRIGESN